MPNRPFVLRQSGKHVLCEKPMATLVEDCGRMVAACQANGVRLMMNAIFDSPCATSVGQPTMTFAKSAPSLTNSNQLTFTLSYANGGPGVILPATGQLGYATLALGSALALFLYPHSVTGVGRPP